MGRAQPESGGFCAGICQARFVGVPSTRSTRPIVHSPAPRRATCHPATMRSASPQVRLRSFASGEPDIPSESQHLAADGVDAHAGEGRRLLAKCTIGEFRSAARQPAGSQHLFRQQLQRGRTFSVTSGSSQSWLCCGARFSLPWLPREEQAHVRPTRVTAPFHPGRHCGLAAVTDCCRHVRSRRRRC